MEFQKQVVALEPSTNTHNLKADNVKAERISDSTVVLEIAGKGVVTHGEHGTVITETPDVIKYVQQEYNPVTRAIQTARD